MEPVKLGRFVLASRTLTLVLVLVLVTISSTNSAKTRSEKQINSLWWNNSIAKVWDKPKTFISDIIGLSALKFLFMMAVPFAFSVFLGAMLVMLFPFPLLTSTSGLAGAAAIGRRSDSSPDDDLSSLISYLGLGNPSSLLSTREEQPPQPHEIFMQPVHLLSSPSPAEFPKINKRQLKLQKFPVYQKAPRFIPVETTTQAQSASKSYVDEDEECYEKIACEIGKSGGRNLRGVVNEIISSLSPQEKHSWYSAIQAYFKGSHLSSSRSFGIIRNNVSIPYMNAPSFVNSNGISNPYQAVINTDSCSNYKCSW